MPMDDVGPLFDWFDDPVVLDEEDLDDDRDRDLDVDDVVVGLTGESGDEEIDPDEVIVLPWRDEGPHKSLEWEDTIARRDERIEDYDGDAGFDVIREYLRETGAAEEVRDALEGLSSEEHETTVPEGDVLDMRNTIRLLAGDTTIEDYYRAWTERPGDDIAVGVSLDMSGSMRSDELEAKAAVGAFLFGVQQLGGTVVANAWHSPAGTVKCRFVTTSGEPFRWPHLDSVKPSGGTPTARGILECGLMLRKVHADESLLVVITDGRPSVRSLEGDPFSGAVDETEHVVQELRDMGLTVYGFGFGRVSESNLESMFGTIDGVPQYRYVDLEDLADELVDLYAERRESQLMLTV